MRTRPRVRPCPGLTLALGDVGSKCCPSCPLPLGTTRMQVGHRDLNVYRSPGGSVHLGHLSNHLLVGTVLQRCLMLNPARCPEKWGSRLDTVGTADLEHSEVW